ncbi:hypothetical protein [Helicobacter typhlonius]|uniref:Putative n=4 Tax=Helicobacter typhlonius TaxID=76936 RepID=A0A099UA92_9HELI|nr:hypothetical protein [Helicobacter typhlonius]TLD78344.1 hypothetical protein LS75_006095 [Helicobacter typhlonius]CUU39183.1 putative [Helicobacter typhlonius]
MKQPTRITIIFSSFFFSLFVFTSLTLFISQFSHSFSYLFLIFMREDQLFDHLITFLFFCTFVFCSVFLILSSWREVGDSLKHIIMLIIGVISVYIVILKLAYVPKPEDIMDMFAIEGSIYHRGFLELLADYLPHIMIVSCVYIFFVYLPLLFEIFALRPNRHSKLGSVLDSMRPSINIVIVMLFGLSVQPYYFRDNIYAYIDILAFIIGLILLVWVMIKHKKPFSFYEYMNFALLILGIIMCFICTSMLSISDNYLNARYAFLVFAFVGWCAEWMYEDTKPIEE